MQEKKTEEKVNDTYLNCKFVRTLLFLMDIKLTIKLNDAVIQRAKLYASSRNTSISRLVENYLDALTSEQEGEADISPFVKSMSSGKPLEAGWSSWKGDYHQYQEEKHH